jgi:hypothetical protein
MNEGSGGQQRRGVAPQDLKLNAPGIEAPKTSSAMERFGSEEPRPSGGLSVQGTITVMGLLICATILYIYSSSTCTDLTAGQLLPRLNASLGSSSSSMAAADMTAPSFEAAAMGTPSLTTDGAQPDLDRCSYTASSTPQKSKVTALPPRAQSAFN